MNPDDRALALIVIAAAFAFIVGVGLLEYQRSLTDATVTTHESKESVKDA